MTPTLVIHGGAGTIKKGEFSQERVEAYKTALREIVSAGQQKLLAGESAVDVVAYTVSLLENSPLFNAGKGSVLTADKTIEMDACIMDGRDKSAGAVSCVHRIANPIMLAKKVMQNSAHVCFTGDGAERFAVAQGIEMIDPSTLVVAERLAQLEKIQGTDKVALDHDITANDKEDATTNKADADSTNQQSSQNPISEEDKYGTVGAVAIDVQGNLASATSTGGMTNKAVGRVGDTPIIGAGCYADKVVAVSTTGTGEAFMRGVVAHDISARIRYGGEDFQDACRHAIDQTLAEVDGEGGLIAIDSQGNIAMPMNTSGMYRAVAIGDTEVKAYIFKHEDD